MNVVRTLLLGFLVMVAPTLSAADAQNVFLITLDGMRWQEVFSGAELALISKEGGVTDTNRLAKAFWRDTPEERRKALLPFTWETIASEGQLFGNRSAGGKARVTNGKNFTYPGFNEILTGFADDRIDKNAKIDNPNVTVLEWLHRKPAFTNKVAAFPNWDVFPYILNANRAGIPVFTGYNEDTLRPTTPAGELIRAMTQDITPVWDGMNFDVFFYHAAVEYLKTHSPRVIWIAFSETDEWAHEGRYDLYLYAANKIDSYIRGIWEAAQSLPAYQGKTAMILTTDHGRGTGLSAWKDHGEKVKGAEEIWISALGPGVPALGVRTNVAEVGQNQIAASIAQLLGEDYKGSTPKAGTPLPFK